MKILLIFLAMYSLVLAQIKVFESVDSVATNIIYNSIGCSLSFINGQQVTTYNLKGEIVHRFEVDIDYINATSWYCLCTKNIVDSDDGFEYLYSTGSKYKLIDDNKVLLLGEGTACFRSDETGTYLVVYLQQKVICYQLNTNQNDISFDPHTLKPKQKKTYSLGYNLLGRRLDKVSAKSIIIKVVK